MARPRGGGLRYHCGTGVEAALALPIPQRGSAAEPGRAQGESGMLFRFCFQNQISLKPAWAKPAAVRGELEQTDENKRGIWC